MSNDRKNNEVFTQGKNAAIPPQLQQHIDAVNAMSGDVPQQAQQVQQPIRTTTQAAIREESIDDMIFRDFGIQVCDELVPLPSKGILYPQEHGYHCRDTVEIKAMTTKEEDILTSPGLLKKGTIITELIRSCLLDKSVNPLDLLSGDRNAIMVGIRVTGYGQQYDGEIECSACNNKSPRTFNLAELEIKPLTLQPIELGINEFEWVTNFKGKSINVHFKFMTGRDEEEIMRMAEKQKKLGLPSDNAVSANLQHCIISVNGVTDRTKISQLITRLPAEFSSGLRKYIKDNEPGLKMTQASVCPNCQHEEEVAIPIGIKFLWPNAE